MPHLVTFYLLDDHETKRFVKVLTIVQSSPLATVIDTRLVYCASNTVNLEFWVRIRPILDGTWWYWVRMAQSLLVLGVDGLDRPWAYAVIKQTACRPSYN